LFPQNINYGTKNFCKEYNHKYRYVSERSFLSDLRKILSSLERRGQLQVRYPLVCVDEKVNSS